MDGVVAGQYRVMSFQWCNRIIYHSAANSAKHAVRTHRQGIAAILMYTINFQCFKPSRSRVHVALFRNVSNSANIKNRIIAASTAEGDEGEKEREAVNFAFIDARLVRLGSF